MTVIWEYINKYFDQSWAMTFLLKNTDTKLIDIATGLSDYLNSKWDPAWNVIVIYFPYENSDSVLYGYAFRDHWMWYNGIKMIDNNYVSFIIWKDYNCIKWFTYNPNKSSPKYSYGSPIYQSIASAIGNSGFDYKDIWKSAKAAVDILYTDSDVQLKLPGDKAFSIIVTTLMGPIFYARFCAKDYYITNSYMQFTNLMGYGSYLLMQTR